MVEPLLVVEDLTVHFDLPKPYPWSKRQRAKVLQGISFHLNRGESLGVVGESGSGKTTLGRALMRILAPTRGFKKGHGRGPKQGRILLDGQDITDWNQRALRRLRADMQMVFQDPQSSLNPRRRIASIVTQPLKAFNRIGPSTDPSIAAGANRKALAESLLVKVGLNPALSSRYPHELSGGQRQRVGIARAIALEPKLLVADEIVSGLDVSSQAQIIALLEQLKREMDLALIFISHDLSVVRKLCDRTIVLHNGRIAEQNHTAELFRFARHPYTRELIRAIPLPEIQDDWLDDPIDNHSEGGLAMQIQGATALITGANRGIGQRYVDALLQRGVKKIYATARNPQSIRPRADSVEVLALDITDHAAITALADKLQDVDLLINNAGVNRMSAFVASDDLAAAREEMEVNYFGTMAMCKAFAPVLKTNGGGAMINMLSILSRVNLPLMGSLCASKSAGLSLVQGVRAELAAQNTAVVAVMPGAVDTDMSKDFPPPKMAPEDVVTAALDGLEQGLEEIYPGEMASGLSQGLSADPKSVEKELAMYLPGG